MKTIQSSLPVLVLDDDDFILEAREIIELIVLDPSTPESDDNEFIRADSSLCHASTLKAKEMGFAIEKSNVPDVKEHFRVRGLN